MAKGYPDYFGYSMFPFYGAPVKIDGATGLIISTGTGNLFNVTVKGSILSGWIGVNSVDLDSLIHMYLTIDGVEMFQTTLSSMLQNNLTKEGESLIYLTRYEPETGYYALAISKGISFSSQFKLDIYNDTTGNAFGVGILYYNNVIS